MQIMEGRPALVFIPGILGSSLRYVGKDRFGARSSRTVWGESGSTNVRILSSEAEILHSHEIRAGHLIRKLQLLGWDWDVYGSLLDFLRAKEPGGLDYSEDRDLLLFAYDWRRSNYHSARSLAEKIREHSTTGPVTLLAHSMGAIIARLMLLTEGNDDILRRTTHLIQIAPPILGSARAYYTLRKRPKLNPALDLVWPYYFALNAGRFHALLSVLNTFPSVFELLPDLPILHAPGDTSSPLEPIWWPPHVHARLKRTREIQRVFRAEVPISTTTYFSNAKATDEEYVVNQHGRIKRVYRPRSEGDGRVTCHSATALTDPKRRRLIDQSGADHQAICGSLELHRSLAAELSAA